MEIYEIINNIIPADNFETRHEFNNRNIIDSLNNEEKKQVENELINRLMIKSDLLIVDTLSYMKSHNSLPVLYSLLNNDCNCWAKIIISAAIYSIKIDNNMVDVAINAFHKLEQNQDNYFKYSVLPIFYYLAKFNNKKTDDILKRYTESFEYLIAYNANKALNK